MNNIILKYGGLAGGFIVMAFTLAFIAIGTSTYSFRIFELFGIASILGGTALGTYFSTMRVRDYHSGGILTFSNGFKVCVQTIMLAAFISGGYVYIHLGFIDPSFMEIYYEFSIEQIQQSGASAEDIAILLKDLEASSALIFRPSFHSMVVFATVLFIGLLVSLIVTLVQRREH